MKEVRDEAYLDAVSLDELVGELAKAARGQSAHEDSVARLADFFGAHFPVLCEVIAETVRRSGHHRLHYWCYTAEMSELANYHFTLE